MAIDFDLIFDKCTKGKDTLQLIADFGLENEFEELLELYQDSIENELQIEDVERVLTEHKRWVFKELDIN